MFNDIFGTWTIFHSLAVAAIAGLLIALGASTMMFINELLAKRADKKLADKSVARVRKAIDPDTAYDHTKHGL